MKRLAVNAAAVLALALLLVAGSALWSVALPCMAWRAWRGQA